MEPDRIGDILGNYRLLSILGTGGFATVYLGEHTYLKSQAAIKVLKSLEQTEKARDKFLKEARTIARLSHPNIIRVIECGVDVSTTTSTPYIVMSYASRGNVQKEYPQGTILPLSTILSFTKTAAEALQYAHDQGIVHCDVKPENMLLGGPQQILLGDFGIANVSHTVDMSTLNSNIHSDPAISANVEGTLTYMAPERLQGQIRRPSDQYSLAIVVYEWLTGDPPFTGTRNQIFYQHMTAPPAPLLPQNPQITPDIERVVLKALQKEPGQRYANIKEFATILEQAIITSPAYISAQQALVPLISTLSEEPAEEPFDIPPDPDLDTADMDTDASESSSEAFLSAHNKADSPVRPADADIEHDDFSTSDEPMQQEPDDSLLLPGDYASPQLTPDNEDDKEDADSSWFSPPDSPLPYSGTKSLEEDAEPTLSAHSDRTWTGVIRLPLEDLDEPQVEPNNTEKDASANPPDQQQHASSGYNHTSSSNGSSQNTNGDAQEGSIFAGFPTATYSREEERPEDPFTTLQMRITNATALDPEFANLTEFRLFRRLGWLVNCLCPLILGIVTHAWILFLLGLLALIAFWLCIRLVSRFLALLAGLVVATCWGGFGILLFQWLQKYPSFTSFPSQIGGATFLVVSAILHIYYITHRLQY